MTTERDGQQIVYSLGDRRIIATLDLMRAVVMDVLREQGRVAHSIDVALNRTARAAAGVNKAAG